MSGPSRLLAALLLASSIGSRALGAQGITSAALQGSVVRVDGAPIGGASVSLLAEASGARWQIATDAAGGYFLENVQVGGPYVIQVTALGFKPVRRSGIHLVLGQRFRADFVLEQAAVELPAVTVGASVDPLLNSGRTGPASVVSETELAKLPNLARDLNVVAALSPFAALRPLGGISIGGQNQGFNSLQVDGGVNADLYLGRTPGGASPSGALPEVLPRAISLETVREFQVLAAPFDVRLGQFAGGLLNAVTKSGTNDFHGSVFAFLQDGGLMAKNRAGQRYDFTTTQYGGTLSGPVIRNRTHFFASADLQQRVVPDAGPFVTETPDQTGARTGVSYASALRFQQILRDNYGLDAGSFGPSDGHLPAQDLFAKVTVQLAAGSHVELSHHYAHGDRQGFIDVGRTFDSTAFSSVSGRSVSTARTSRAIWNALIRGRAQNELILSYEQLRDVCRPSATFPLIAVAADLGVLLAGPNSVCPTTDVNQSALELTDNLTIGAGRHVLTAGSHAELLHFRDPLVQVSAGRWDFVNLDSLERGVASHYDRGLPAPPPRSPGAEFHVIGLGIYAQDRWVPAARLTLTAGLRLDVSILPDAAVTNPALSAANGIDTGRLPSGDPSWSPRLGINYDLRGDGSTFLRGGIGLFGGPPPYRWLGNGYRDSGEEMLVTCDRSEVPLFIPDPQPTACRSGAGTSPRISFFDPDFGHPQNLKLAFGVDRRLSREAVATIDVLYTRAIRQIYISEANLGAPSGRAAGEGGRLLYGTIDAATGLARPDWSDATFREIYRISSRGGDEGVSLSAQVRAQAGQALALYASYAYSRVRDRMSLVNFPARANFSNTPLDGTLDNRRLRPSFFETPHKVSLTATLDLPYESQLALLYSASSQPAFTYVINGDANADGIGGAGSLKNDIVYVPRDGDDISLLPASDTTRLNAFVEQNQCLREQRGRVMERSSCRNRWLGILNARLTKAFFGAGDQHFDIVADVYNLPNLFNSRWGRQRDVTTAPSVTLMRLVGWDSARARGVYRLPPRLPERGVLDDLASRWRGQVGARYYF
jgi:hypothetical protein